MEITENRLLKKLSRFGRKSANLIRGIGDDGAVVRLSDGPYVFVQDVVVERIHFDLTIQKPFDVGKKAVYVNVSDVLAMGAQPLYFLVTLGLPPRVDSGLVEELYRGMDKAAREFGLTLAGGDTSETREDFFVDVSMTGRLIVPEYLGRDKAEVGDLIGVTGLLGEAAYGLYLLKNQKGGQPNRFTRRYAAPGPPFDTWKGLVDLHLPKAMMDVSDGLLIDLERMMEESGKAAEVHLEQVPMPAVLKREGKELFALAGGEDYQFLFTFDRSRLAEVEALKKRRFRVSVIGHVRAGKGVHLFQKGRERKVAMKGYEHFRLPPGNRSGITNGQLAAQIIAGHRASTAGSHPAKAGETPVGREMNPTGGQAE